MPAAVPDAPDVKERRVTTRDGQRIACTHYRSGRDGVILIAHGFLQHRRTRLFRVIAERLAAQSDVISLDFRGHGQSGGWYTYSARETLDLQAVLALARPAYRRVSVVGFSMGTVAAVEASASAGAVDRLVLVSPPMAWEAIENRWWVPWSVGPALRRWQPGLPARLGWMHLPKPRPLELIPRVAPTPVLIIHGTRDAIVHHRHGLALHAAAGAPKRLELIDGGLHAETLFAQHPHRLLALIRRWCNDAAPPMQAVA